MAHFNNVEFKKNGLKFYHKEKALNQVIEEANEEKKEYKDKLDELEQKLEETVFDM